MVSSQYNQPALTLILTEESTLVNNFVILNSETHRDLRLLDNLPYNDMRNIKNCQITGDEISMACSSFPVFFLKNEENGQFILSAIFTFQNNGNLFVGRNGWDSPYMPLNIKRQPLALGQEVTTMASHARDVYINTASKLTSTVSGSRLFHQDGSETLLLMQRKKRLLYAIDGEEKTKSLIASILDYDLMSPVSITLSTGEGDKLIQGIYGIDPAKIKYMAPKSCLSLIEAGILDNIFMMIASYSQISRLIWLENKKLWRENNKSSGKITNYSISYDH